MTYQEAISQTPVALVEFYATWCPHCQRMAPVVEEIKALLDGQATVIQLDVDSNQEAAESENVDSTPTFIIYRNGREVWRQAGEMDGDTLASAVQTYL